MTVVKTMGEVNFFSVYIIVIIECFRDLFVVVTVNVSVKMAGNICFVVVGIVNRHCSMGNNVEWTHYFWLCSSTFSFLLILMMVNPRKKSSAKQNNRCKTTNVVNVENVVMSAEDIAFLSVVGNAASVFDFICEVPDYGIVRDNSLLMRRK